MAGGPGLASGSRWCSRSSGRTGGTGDGRVPWNATAGMAGEGAPAREEQHPSAQGLGCPPLSAAQSSALQGENRTQTGEKANCLLRAVNRLTAPQCCRQYGCHGKRSGTVYARFFLSNGKGSGRTRISLQSPLLNNQARTNKYVTFYITHAHAVKGELRVAGVAEVQNLEGIYRADLLDVNKIFGESINIRA